MAHRWLILETSWEIWKFSFQRDNEFNTDGTSLSRLEPWWQIGSQLSPKAEGWYKFL